LIGNSTPRGWWPRHIAVVAARPRTYSPIRAAAISANDSVSAIPASTPITDQPSRAARRALALGRRASDALARRPRPVVSALIAANIAATALFGLAVPHNGWVWFQGGDQIAYATDGTLVAGFHLPPADLGFGWPFVLAPIRWVTGPAYTQMLPVVILLQVLVLGPVAVLSVYSLATRIGGRLLGYWATVLWVVAPYATIPLFVSRYLGRYEDQILPQSLGLSALADYPSMVALLACAALAARAITLDSKRDGALAGLVLGFAVAMKPPNALFALGAVAAFALARRWRTGATVAAALVPAVVALTLWKSRGLGHVPLFSLGGERLASGKDQLLAVGGIDVHRYVHLDWGHWKHEMDQLREFFWSSRLVQWAPFAGVLAVARRTWPLAALLAGWLGAFVIVKGFSPAASIESGSFWRLLMPAWPAYLILFASIPLLLPTVVPRLGQRTLAPPASPVGLRPVVAAVVVLAVVPLVAVLVLRPLPSQDANPAVIQQVGGNILLTATDRGIHVSVKRQGSTRVLTWRTPRYGPKVFYRIYRTDNPRGDTRCENSGGSARCFLVSDVIATTTTNRFVDSSPHVQPYYRIGVGTNYLDDPSGGDVFIVSPETPG